MENKVNLQAELAALTERIAGSPDNYELYMERGKLYLQSNGFGNAMNDFTRAAHLAPEAQEPREYISMIREILDFHYVDIYNP